MLANGEMTKAPKLCRDYVAHPFLRETRPLQPSGLRRNPRAHPAACDSSAFLCRLRSFRRRNMARTKAAAHQPHRCQVWADCLDRASSAFEAKLTTATMCESSVAGCQDDGTMSFCILAFEAAAGSHYCVVLVASCHFARLTH